MPAVLGASLVPCDRDHVHFKTRRLPVEMANALAYSGCWLSKSRSEPDYLSSVCGNKTTQNWPCKRSNYESPKENPNPKRTKFFFSLNKKICWIHRGFEQLPSSIGRRIIVLQTLLKQWLLRSLKANHLVMVDITTGIHPVPKALIHFTFFLCVFWDT